MEGSDFGETKQQEQHVTINKSVYNRLVMSIVSVAIVSAFLGGYVMGGEMAEPKEIIIRETISDVQSK